MVQKKLNKKGRCLNIGNCSKANTKEIIEVGIGEDFVCPECGGQLVEVKKINVLPYIAGGIVVVALVVSAIFWIPGLMGLSTAEKEFDETDTVEQVEQVTTTGSEEQIVEAEAVDRPAVTDDIPAETPPVVSVQNGQGTIDFGYAKYEGSISNGKANGLGKLTYTQSRRISKRDTRNRVAVPGDYIEGSFEDNEPVTVKWYGSDKKLKGAVMIGSNGL